MTAFANVFLPEFNQELANTRKVLERVPEDKLGWRAHPKSNTISWVANHLANIPSWTGWTFKATELDVAPKDGPAMKTEELKTRQAILDYFDKNVSEARQAIERATDTDLGTPWTLLSGGEKVLTMPRAAVLRTFVLNHIIHHRAILCVYLRLNDVPVPGMYGPSGDE